MPTTLDLEDCDCCPTHKSPCNGTTPINKALTTSASFNGSTVNAPTTWIKTTSSCAGKDGWEYDTPDLTICDNGSTSLKLRGVSLCCNGADPSAWGLGLAIIQNGIQQSYTTGGGGIEGFTVVTSNPLRIIAQISGITFCGVTDDLLIDIL